jgi:glycosyltransferase involved in cell wall biosynthesis
MNTKNVSIIIRTLNEKEELANVFEALSQQNFAGESEIIVVDNESSDGTKELAEEHGAKVLTIRKDEFTYPKSMNMGVKEAKYPIVILLVGHAIPIGKNWMNAAIKHFEDSKVAGVYSPVIPKKPFSVSEFFLYYPRFIYDKLRSPFTIREAGRGVFAAHNIALRKELWDEHNFEEKYELGGEDTH